MAAVVYIGGASLGGHTLRRIAPESLGVYVRGVGVVGVHRAPLRASFGRFRPVALKERSPAGAIIGADQIERAAAGVSAPDRRIVRESPVFERKAVGVARDSRVPVNHARECYAPAERAGALRRIARESGIAHGKFRGGLVGRPLLARSVDRAAAGACLVFADRPVALKGGAGNNVLRRSRAVEERDGSALGARCPRRHCRKIRSLKPRASAPRRRSISRRPASLPTCRCR